MINTPLVLVYLQSEFELSRLARVSSDGSVVVRVDYVLLQRDVKGEE
jgi:hypothetical protein